MLTVIDIDIPYRAVSFVYLKTLTVCNTRNQPLVMYWDSMCDFSCLQNLLV